MHAQVDQSRHINRNGFTRPVVMGTRGMVAAAHPLASLAGLDVLRDGGNAFDAAVAVNAVLNVTQPQHCGIGGDAFFLLYEARAGRLSFLNASGRAAAAAEGNIFRQRGLERIPPRGSAAVLTVPGCVDGWAAMLSRYGTMGLPQLLAPAIEYAEAGHPVSHQLSSWIALDAEVLRRCPEAAGIFLPGGQVPQPGEILYQRDLAETLKAIAAGGREEFYQGGLAARITGDLQARGGFLTSRDFAQHRSDWGEALGTVYRDYTVWQTPPNTQGIAALEALNILEGIDVHSLGHNSPQLLHWMAETKKLVFRDRDRFLSDPDFTEIPAARLLSKEYAARLREQIDPYRAMPAAAAVEPGGDTTYFAVVDGGGNIVSGIQSLYFSFGSGIVPQGTGVLLHNRGAYFSLADNHVNILRPYKRTLHTLTAAMVFKGQEPYLVFGTMGGDGQVQTHLAVLTNVLDFGMNIQEAIEAPRWLHGGTRVGEDSQALNLEGRISREVGEALAKLGHKINYFPAWASKLGHAQGIIIDRDKGVIHGGADPRGDGYALGW